jgi:hypothetical protein
MSRPLNRTLCHKLAETYASRYRGKRIPVTCEHFHKSLQYYEDRNRDFELEIQELISRTIKTPAIL